MDLACDEHELYALLLHHMPGHPEADFATVSVFAHDGMWLRTLHAHGLPSSLFLSERGHVLLVDHTKALEELYRDGAVKTRLSDLDRHFACLGSRRTVF
jgi:hypothetical protein